VIADQADRATLAHQSRAGIGLDAVAEHVAETPELLHPRRLRRLQDGLEGRQVGVNIADGPDPQAAQPKGIPAAA